MGVEPPETASEPVSLLVLSALVALIMLGFGYVVLRVLRKHRMG